MKFFLLFKVFNRLFCLYKLQKQLILHFVFEIIFTRNNGYFLQPAPKLIPIGVNC
jgi:hypothetical protein